MSGEANPSTTTTSVSTNSSQEMEELASDLSALKIREALPRQEVMKMIRSMRMDIRKFQQIVPKDLSYKLSEMESTDAEHGSGKEKLVQSEDLSFVHELLHEIGNIELYMAELQQQYEGRPAEEDKVLIDLTELRGHKAMMNSLIQDVKMFLNNQWLTEGHSEDTSMFPVLPPLPHLEICQGRRQVKTEGSSSDSDTSSSDCSDMEELEELCHFKGPYWEALTAPTKVLATDDEEEAMIMDASILLGSDWKAKSIITAFDQSESSLNANDQLGGTSRHFLQNLPLVFVCNSHKCAICRTAFPSKDRCARLPCRHCFHVSCILEWLLKKTTCPMCRHELPRR